MTTHVTQATHTAASGTHDWLPQPRRLQVAATQAAMAVILAALLATWATMTVIPAIMLGGSDCSYGCYVLSGTGYNDRCACIKVSYIGRNEGIGSNCTDTPATKTAI